MDLASFERLVEAHHPAVAAVGFAITRDASLADDIAQDTFIAAWDARASLRDPSRVRAWLCGIARNLSKNALRDRRREVAGDPQQLDAQPAGAPSVVDAAVERETNRELSIALAEIPEDYREPLVLFYWQDQSIEQVAAGLAISEQAAQKRISRARSFLKAGMTAQLEQSGRARKQAARAASVVLVALAAARPTLAHAAPATKGSTMWSSTVPKVGLVTVAAATLVGGIIWKTRGQASPSRPGDVTTAPSTTATRMAPTAPSVPALPPGSTAPPRGYEPGQPSPLPTFGSPNAYELTVLSATSVAVDLGGGRAPVFVPIEPDPPTLTRHVRGRIVDERGRGLAGAVIVAGDAIRAHWGSVMGDEGATSGADGSFDLALHSEASEYAIALHGSGWSAPISLAAGRADIANVTVTVPTPGTMALHATQAGAGREASVMITQPGLYLSLETDVHGDFTLPRLAPGRYHVRAQPLQALITGGTGKPIDRDVDVAAGAIATVPLELSTGTLLVVTPSHAMELVTIEYFLSPGTDRLPLAELSKRARSGALMDTLYGGVDLDNPMQFHELSPGSYTLCIDARAADDHHLPLDCRTVEVTGDKPVIELDVTLR